MTAQQTTSRRGAGPRHNTAPAGRSGKGGTLATKNNIHKKRHGSDPEKASGARRYLASLAPSGSRSQRWALAEMATIWRGKPVKDCCRLAWHRITAAAVDRIRQQLAVKFNYVTVNRCLTALRRTLKEEWRSGRLTREAFERLADVPPVRGETLPGRAVRRDEVEAMLAVCERDRSPAGARDGAAVVLCFCSGLRRAEAAALDLDDLLADGEVAVAGKGGSLALASLGAGAPWVARWLAVRGPGPGPLLTHVRPTGKVVLNRLCGAAVGAIVTRRARQAGLELSAHCLRRGFASALLRRGADHLMVARALRHRDVRSVQRYDARTDLERALAVRGALVVSAPQQMPDGGAAGKNCKVCLPTPAQCLDAHEVDSALGKVRGR
jgi:integrase